ncbi:hypothetical protein BN874_1610009 [Candidatus Contendobacter odensis Run_B_J11]|uniref:Uncharacterized protein n=1 Tax=Candidatus Contendobacter odensis Run_B_J11 TaxID=1400861 RepID=A0A7U7G9H2_9GAMM|nr:hypothetical protein BN874_1610009 [Candidatus Contendobacter odensis Run_B_J11]
MLAPRPGPASLGRLARVLPTPERGLRTRVLGRTRAKGAVP